MMFKVLLLVASATAVFGFSIPLKTCDGKIVGGTTVAQGEIPWQVSIQTLGGSQYCGGSIIGSEWIVTAAHCSGITTNNYQVRAGTLRYMTGGTTHRITQIVVHESYSSITQENDIAVWKVSPPFTFDANTAPVALPAQGTESSDGTLVTISGWGDTTQGGLLSLDLLKVEAPIVDKATCDSSYASFGGIPPNQICAGYTEGGKDSCQGDSGGPLFLDGVLYGIVSWGNGCALPNYPGVYTEVSAYRSWITQQTGI